MSVFADVKYSVHFFPLKLYFRKDQRMNWDEMTAWVYKFYSTEEKKHLAWLKFTTGKPQQNLVVLKSFSSFCLISIKPILFLFIESSALNLTSFEMRIKKNVGNHFEISLFFNLSNKFKSSDYLPYNVTFLSSRFCIQWSESRLMLSLVDVISRYICDHISKFPFI